MGILPERVLFRISRILSKGASANLTRMEPKSLLKLKPNLVNMVRPPKLAGIALVNRLCSRARTLSFWRYPSYAGTFPLKLL